MFAGGSWAHSGAFHAVVAGVFVGDWIRFHIGCCIVSVGLLVVSIGDVVVVVGVVVVGVIVVVGVVVVVVVVVVVGVVVVVVVGVVVSMDERKGQRQLVVAKRVWSAFH